MPVIRLDDRVIHYHDQGPKDGQTMAFANSLGTDFRIWEDLLPRMPEGLRLIRYDKAGHGLSDFAGERPMEGHGDDLAGLLDHLGIDQAVVVGLSIGGLIGQVLAAARPELVKALVLMDTGHKIGTVDMWQQRMDTIADSGIEAIADGTMQRWFAPSFHQNRPDELALWRNMLVRTPDEGYLACCAAIRDADLTESTKAINAPTLCLVGDSDAATPPDLVRELAGLIEGAELTVIDDAGHLPCIDQPHAVAAAINGFLRSRDLV